jgi:hypothetical protein
LMLPTHLEHNDKDDGLCWRDVWKHSVDLPREANERAVDHDANKAHHLHSSLPRANVCHSLPERPLVDKAELERVALDLEQVVEERPERGERVRRREQGHVAKLDKHFEVVFERALVLGE